MINDRLDLSCARQMVSYRVRCRHVNNKLDAPWIISCPFSEDLIEGLLQPWSGCAEHLFSRVANRNISSSDFCLTLQHPSIPFLKSSHLSLPTSCCFLLRLAVWWVLTETCCLGSSIMHPLPRDIMCDKWPISVQTPIGPWPGGVGGCVCATVCKSVYVCLLVCVCVLGCCSCGGVRWWREVVLYY